MPRKDIIFDVTSVNLSVVIMPRRPITICELRSLRNWKLISYGISHCREYVPRNLNDVYFSYSAWPRDMALTVFVADRYDRMVGARQALKSALRRIPDGDESVNQINQTVRKAVWQKFNSIFPPPSPKSVAKERLPQNT